MSKISDVRSNTDSAVEQGKSALTAMPDRLVSLTGDAARRAGASVEDSKAVAATVVSLTRRQAHINVGIGDTIVATVTKRTAEFPDDAKQAASDVLDATRRRVDDAAGRAARAQDKLGQVAGALSGRVGDTIDSARGFTLAGATSGVRDDVQSRIARIVDGLNKFAERGEKITDDLRHDPVVARVLSNAGTSVEQAANEVTSVAQKVRARAAAQAERESAAATATPVRLVAPGQIPTHKTTVRKTRSGEAAVNPVPTHRAAAHEAEVRKAAAAKAADTRRQKAEAAEQATQTRKRAAQKAARTRNANAGRPAAKRSTAGAKATKRTPAAR